MDDREIRLRRLSGRRNAVVTAIDHGMFDGSIVGMEDPPAAALP